jgi:hypothetical protein
MIFKILIPYNNNNNNNNNNNIETIGYIIDM